MDLRRATSERQARKEEATEKRTGQEQAERLKLAVDLVVQNATGRQEGRAWLLREFMGYAEGQSVSAHNHEFAEDVLDTVAAAKKKFGHPDWLSWQDRVTLLEATGVTEREWRRTDSSASAVHHHRRMRVAELSEDLWQKWLEGQTETIARLERGDSPFLPLPGDTMRAVTAHTPGVVSAMRQEIDQIQMLRRGIVLARRERLEVACEANRLPDRCEREACRGRVLFEGEVMECPLRANEGCPWLEERKTGDRQREGAMVDGH